MAAFLVFTKSLNLPILSRSAWNYARHLSDLFHDLFFMRDDHMELVSKKTKVGLVLLVLLFFFAPACENDDIERSTLQETCIANHMVSSAIWNK